MITYIVGHRGVGKSTFLSRVQAYYAEVGLECTVIDLDREIEIEQGLSIGEIFAKHGIEAFRKLEQEMVQKMGREYGASSNTVYIAVGAGYSGPFTDHSQVLWLRRQTDKDGRVFLDRPSLDLSLDPYSEYMSRFGDREYKYLQTADEQLLIGEGLNGHRAYETVFLGFPGLKSRGCLTLFPRDLRKFSGPESFIGRRLHWDVDYFEARDDILEDNLIRYLLGMVPKNKLLLSFRKPQQSILSSVSLKGFLFDWPIEKGPCPYPGPGVFSMHERGDSLVESLHRFEELAPEGFHLKLAAEINSWSELLEGHLWWREDPLKRSFLPSSRKGRWRWYRTLFGRQMKISFFREGAGSSPDQPFLFEWIKAPVHFSSFAAVLGNPVHQSYSPSFHASFFEQRRMPFVAIPLDEEGFAEQLGVLQQLGLRAAAVTSPFKQEAFRVCKSDSAEASKFQSVNTLTWQEDAGHWLGENTDIIGLSELARVLEDFSVNNKEVIIWGGGGTRQAIKGAFPEASSYSARTGRPNDGETSISSPRVVVWAVGRHRQSECVWPPQDWKVEVVIDLNYSADSPGREYAIRAGAKYIDGLEMFEAQGLGQQKVWREASL